MKEIKAGLFGNKIYEFEITDLAQLRKTVAESWPIEGYLLQNSGKTYMISKHFMLSLIKEAGKTIVSNEAKHKTISLEENRTSAKGGLENRIIDNKQVEISRKLETIEQQLTGMLNLFKRSSEERSSGNKTVAKMFEYLDSGIREIQESLAINSDKINMNISNISANIKDLDESLSYCAELCNKIESVNKGITIANTEEDNIGWLLRELYRTSCEMNKVILDTALQFVMEEPIRK